MDVRNKNIEPSFTIDKEMPHVLFKIRINILSF